MKVNGISFCGNEPLSYSKLEMRPQEDEQQLGETKAGDIIQINYSNGKSDIGLVKHFQIMSEPTEEYELDCINLTKLIREKNFDTIHVEHEGTCGGPVFLAKRGKSSRFLNVKEIRGLGSLDIFA